MNKGQIIGIIALGLIALVVFDTGTREWVLGVFGIGPVRKDSGLSGEVVKDSESEPLRVTRFDNVYHREDCPRLQGKPSFYCSLSKAKELYTACPECNPPR